MNRPKLFRQFAIATVVVVLLGLTPSAVFAAQDRVFKFTVLPSTTQAGVAQTFDVTVYQLDGTTVDTAYTGQVHFTSSDGAAVLPADYTFTGSGFDDGVHSFTGGLTLKTVGSGTQTITVRDNDNTENFDTSDPIAVTPASASHLVVVAPGSVSVAAPFTVTVTAKDQFGNTATDYTGTVTFTSTATAPTLPPNHTFTSGDNGVHIFTDGVTFHSVESGTETVTATDTLDGLITGQSGDISVSKGTPTITFTSTAPVGAVVGGPTYNVTASSPSPVGIVFSIDASASTICSIVGSTVSFIGAGTCRIDANQAANANWNAAAQVQQSFSVGKGTQTITFGVLAAKRMDESGFIVSATASSGLPAYFTSATISVCSVSGTNGSTITLVAIGTCTIVAHQDGDSNWTPAATVPQSFTVSQGIQTVNFTTSVPPAYIFGPTYTPLAAATSGLVVTITVDASSSTVCSISGGVVSFTGIGTCTLDANQAGNANWGAATQTQQIIPVSSGLAVSLTLSVPPSAFLGAPFTVIVTARDTIGNAASGYTGTVHFSSTDPTAGLPANYTFLASEHSVHTFTMAFTFHDMGGGTRTLTATDVGSPSIAGTSAEIGVGPVNCTYHPLTPTRLLDSRVGTGLSGPFNSHVARTFQVTGRGGVPAGATAVTGNLTVTQQSRNGFLYIGPVAMNNPTSSTLNFPVADDRANAVTVALGAGGTLSVTYVGSGPGTAYVIFDVTGYFTPDMTGATYYPLNPTRLLDTRAGIGGSGVPLSSHVARTFQVTGGVVPSVATAVTGNLTVTQQSRNGFFYIGPIAVNNPTSSTLNFPVGDDRANSVTVALGAGGTLSVTYAAPVLGPTAQAIFDVTGYFAPDAGGVKFVALSPSRILDTRDGIGGLSVNVSHVAQTFTVRGHGGVPSNAKAITGNLTVTQQSRNGFLFMGPVATNDPTSSTLNFPVGDDRANAVTVSLGTGSALGTLSVTYVGSSPGTAQVIFDVSGYFVP